MDTLPKSRMGLLLVLAASILYLAAADSEEVKTTALRLAPVLLFVAGMSVTVNLAARTGAFEAIARALEERVKSEWALWLGIVVLAIVSTAFLSLDTTAIMVTPMAVALARRNGLKVVPLSFAVVWIANLGSLALPVSNLTNLLSHPYGSAAVPAVAAVAVAVAASWAVYRFAPSEPESRDSVITAPTSPLLKKSLIVLSLLPPALVSPLPYWAVSTVAAAVLLAFVRPDCRAALSLVPWNSLLLAAAFSFSVGAVLVLAGSRLNLEMGPATLCALGAVTANILNNIPAYLLLEPATSTPQHTLALLIGVNCGPIVTPWASLATLLWHDQLRRSGIEIPWRTVAAKGAVLAPFAVSVPLAGLSLVSCSSGSSISVQAIMK